MFILSLLHRPALTVIFGRNKNIYKIYPPIFLNTKFLFIQKEICNFSIKFEKSIEDKLIDSIILCDSKTKHRNKILISNSMFAKGFALDFKTL